MVQGLIYLTWDPVQPAAFYLTAPAILIIEGSEALFWRESQDEIPHQGP